MDDSNEGRAYNWNSFSLAGRRAYSHITRGAQKEGEGGRVVSGSLRYLTLLCFMEESANVRTVLN